MGFWRPCRVRVGIPLHVPDRYEHLVRYAGWYSNRARGERAKKASEVGPAEVAPTEAEPASEFAARARANWARLIQKVYEVDPLECPACGARMRVIALIEEPGVIERILRHLGLWVLDVAQTQGAPPGADAWPVDANLALTYHPVPDIA